MAQPSSRRNGRRARQVRFGSGGGVRTDPATQGTTDRTGQTPRPATPSGQPSGSVGVDDRNPKDNTVEPRQGGGVGATDEPTPVDDGDHAGTPQGTAGRRAQLTASPPMRRAHPARDRRISLRTTTPRTRTTKRAVTRRRVAIPTRRAAASRSARRARRTAPARKPARRADRARRVDPTTNRLTGSRKVCQGTKGEESRRTRGTRRFTAAE